MKHLYDFEVIAGTRTIAKGQAEADNKINVYQLLLDKYRLHFINNINTEIKISSVEQ